MNVDMTKASPQELFDAVVYADPKVMQALIVGMAASMKNMEHIVEHGMYPDNHWDDVEYVAKEHGFEFTHPKYTKGPQLVESQPKPTVH